VATAEELREALLGLVHAVREDQAEIAEDWFHWLLNRTGREWLLLDGIARGRGWNRGVVVGSRWAERSLGKRPELIGEVVVSWHVDGRLRERATQRLALRSDRISAAALAVRCLDHVPQVRDQALSGLLLEPRIEAVDAVIAVLAAGLERSGARAALTAYTDRVLVTPDGAEALLSHTQHRDHGVSRWVAAFALDRQLLTPEQVLELSRTHLDPLVRARYTARVVADSPEMLTRLLNGRFVDSRVAALQQLPDRDLSEARLRSALLDRSPRVRAVAQLRSRSRDLDAATVYRSQLGNTVPKRAAAALSGLAAVSTAQDAPHAVRLLDHPQPTVRAAAVGALAALAGADEVIPLATPLLLDSSTKVITAATQALVRVDAGATAATTAWQHPQVASRRAAWRVSRAAGGWDKVVADLMAANDADPVLAQNGRTALKTWLVFGAARTWQQATGAQQASIADLLTGSALGKKASRQVAFHAGVSWNAPTTAPAQQVPASPPPRLRWWQRLRQR
jgi:hypothetical protein